MTATQSAGCARDLGRVQSSNAKRRCDIWTADCRAYGGGIQLAVADASGGSRYLTDPGTPVPLMWTLGLAAGGLHVARSKNMMRQLR